MKILVVGADGAVGSAAVEALSERHEIIKVGRTSGDIRADVNVLENVRALYAEVGTVGAVVSAVGSAEFDAMDAMGIEQFMYGIHRKVMPQIHLVLEGIQAVDDGGSFTLTSGVSNRDPVPGGAAAAAANGALDGFVTGAAVDMPRGIRINAVSPEALEVSRDRHPDRFRGHVHVSRSDVGRAFVKSVEGGLSGKIFVVD